MVCLRMSICASVINITLTNLYQELALPLLNTYFSKSLISTNFYSKYTTNCLNVLLMFSFITTR